MKAGDRVLVKNLSGDTKEATVVEVMDQSVKIKYDDIGGHFIFLKSIMSVIDKK